jgi:hypothetical protein
MKTGDIILISGNGNQAKLIQKFQSLEDIPSSKYNHSGVLYISLSGAYVVEASYIQQRKLKAAVIITPLEEYFNSNCEIMLLQHAESYSESKIESELFKYIGTPYGYVHLTIVQAIWKVFGKWIGKKKDNDKRFICHEFSMTIWNRVNGIFPECYKGNVKDIWYSKNFFKKKLK